MSVGSSNDSLEQQSVCKAIGKVKHPNFVSSSRNKGLRWVVYPTQGLAVSQELTMASTRLQRVEYERPFRPATLYRELPRHIGEALRRHYKPAEELPDQLLTLLTQLTGPEEDD